MDFSLFIKQFIQKPFLKIIERKKLKETGDSRYIYRNVLDKACFQHNITYGDFKDLPRKKAADEV